MYETMPYMVYVLRSESTGRFYIGHTDNLARRVSQHNDPEYHGSKHTKRNKGPWICVYKEEFINRSEAVKREKELKMKKSRKYIENLLGRQSPEGVRD
jgi:putative endonuclease